MPDLTGSNTHRAIRRGFAGTLVEPGETISPGFVVGSWMVECEGQPEAPAEASKPDVTDLQAQVAKFDHDGDGRPGGSRKRRKN